MPIRIYGMTYFDENGEYWGNKTEPIIAGVSGRLNARSVKIFADGMYLLIEGLPPSEFMFAGALRSGGAAVHLIYPISFNSLTDSAFHTAIRAVYRQP